MSKVIRRLRIAKEHFKHNAVYNNEPLQIPNTPGPCIVSQILHERGRNAPVAILKKDGRKFKVAATEGNYIGQEIMIESEVPSINNCCRLETIPEGAIVCMVERVPFDGGRIAVSSGSSCQVVGHMGDHVSLKMPSGHKVSIPKKCRAFIGIVAGGGRTEKPVLKAGRAFHKNKARGIYWPRVRGVAMNPLDHPHGGGNHQHIGHPSTISKNAAPGQKVGLIGARRTGLRRGIKKVINK